MRKLMILSSFTVLALSLSACNVLPKKDFSKYENAREDILTIECTNAQAVYDLYNKVVNNQKESIQKVDSIVLREYKETKTYFVTQVWETTYEADCLNLKEKMTSGYILQRNFKTKSQFKKQLKKELKEKYGDDYKSIVEKTTLKTFTVYANELYKKMKYEHQNRTVEATIWLLPNESTGYSTYYGAGLDKTFGTKQKKSVKRELSYGNTYETIRTPFHGLTEYKDSSFCRYNEAQGYYYFSYDTEECKSIAIFEENLLVYSSYYTYEKTKTHREIMRLSYNDEVQIELDADEKWVDTNIGYAHIVSQRANIENLIKNW